MVCLRGRGGEYLMKTKQELVHEKFLCAGLYSRLDSKNRVTLSQALNKVWITEEQWIDEFEILLGATGDILLRPRTAIPTRELWLHQNPDSMKTLQKGLKDASKKRVTRVKNLKKFTDNL